MISWILIALSSSSAVAAHWDGYNDPSRFSSGYEFRFDLLPLSADLPSEMRPWSESYWPKNKGSINLRWNASPPVGFGYHSPTREEVLQMSEADLRRLSPSEKYDLYLGRYDYPLKNRISRSEADSNAPDWYGICDGWTAAAVQLREPQAVTLKNPDGVEIPFGASDVKGLISYAAARQDLDSVVVGRYCPLGLRLGFSNCQDINPGTFHVILANEIGLRHRAFPAEVDPGKEAWNQPVYGFEFQVLGSAPGGVRIHSKLHYVEELDQSRWDPVTGTSNWSGAIQDSEYILELDGEKRITGGHWLTKYSHPDVFWRPGKRIVFDGLFASLKEIYRPIEISR